MVSCRFVGVTKIGTLFLGATFLIMFGDIAVPTDAVTVISGFTCSANASGWLRLSILLYPGGMTAGGNSEGREKSLTKGD